MPSSRGTQSARRRLGQGVLVVLTAALAGCVSLRDTRCDHLLPPPAATMVDLGQYKSVQDRADGQAPELAVAAAISGGGHRAANFAMGALLALEAFELDGRKYDLLKEIDYFSTVSGGGFAAAVYVSSLYDHLRTVGETRSGYSLAAALTNHQGRLLVNLERDYQGTIFEGLLHVGCLGYRDSGDVFERKLDRCMLGSAYRRGKTSLTMGDLFRPKDSPEPVRLPYWVPNATVYENGARFPFAPGVLAGCHVRGCVHNMRNVPLLGDAFRMPLAVGMKASASFPVAFPATTLACDDPDDKLNRFLHLMDGGLADNMGYRTAVELLRQDKAKHKVLLIIDAYKGVSHPHSASERSPAGPEAAARILTIALDGDHSRLPADLPGTGRLADGRPGKPPIRVILLSFEQLKPDPEERGGDAADGPDGARREVGEVWQQRLRREMNAALKLDQSRPSADEDRFALYHGARAVATSLNITRGEQRLLLKAGRAVVDKNRGLLRQYIVGPISADAP